MTIQTIGSAGIALFIDGTDLQKCGLSADNLDLDDARFLVEAAFEEAGIAQTGKMEIEAFPNNTGVLVFARVIPAEPSVFGFDDFEDLIQAALRIRFYSFPSRLTYLQGKYYITLFGNYSPLTTSILNEFGEKHSASAIFSSHLSEHGEILIDNNAMLRLNEIFK